MSSGKFSNDSMDYRKYVRNSGSISKDEQNNEITSLAELLNVDESKTKTLNEFSFESFEKDNIHNYTNILYDYIVTYDNSEHTVELNLKISEISLFMSKLKSISRWFYGNNLLFFVILQLNYIEHPADLNESYLQNNKLIVLNKKGILKLREIYNFKKVQEQATQGLNNSQVSSTFVIKEG